MSPARSPARRSTSSSPTPSPRSLRIRQLFREWRAGDERAGEALFRELRVTLCACFRGHPAHMIDDLVQEAFVACVLARSAIRCEEAFMSYVYTIARRLPIHQQRRRRSQPTIAFDETIPLEGLTFDRIDQQLEAQRFLFACRSPCAQLVALRYLEGRHGVEIARSLRISEASVRRRIRRGLAELRASAGLPTPP